MEQSEIIEELSGFLNSYEAYKERAIKLEWIEVKEEHVDWSKKYPLGIMIDVLQFPKDYVGNNFTDAYVRGILSSMAYFEEWDANFWNMKEGERRKVFHICEQHKSDVYRTYFELRELRLKSITSEFLIGELEYFSKENGATEGEIHKYSEMIRNAICIELGGCYAGDYNYLAVWNDVLIFINCGVWD